MSPCPVSARFVVLVSCLIGSVHGTGSGAAGFTPPVWQQASSQTFVGSGAAFPSSQSPATTPGITRSSGAQAPSDDPAALLRQARILMRNAKVGQAIAVLERLVAIDPESISARLNLGRMYRADGQVLKAKEEFEAVGKLDPYNEAAFCELAILYTLNSQPETALKVIAPVLRDHPLSVPAHVAKAQALIKMSKLEEAQRLLDDALEIDPQCYEAHYWLAHLALTRKLVAPAVGHLRRCLAIQNQLGLDPVYGIPACEQLGDLYLNLGRYAEAITMLNNVVTVSKNRFAVHYKLGVAHGMMYHYDKAAHHLTEAIKINPSDYLARVRYAYILEAQGFLEQSLKQYQVAGEIDPSQSFVHGRIGNILAQLSRRDDAKKEFEQAILLGAFNAEPFFLMAKALREEKKYKEAVGYLEKGLELEPLHVESYYLLSQILPRTKEEGDRKKAVEYAKIYKKLMPKRDLIAKYTSMLEISPSQVGARVELVKIMREIGRTDASLRYLNDGVKIAPQNVGLREERARVCMELKMLLPAQRDLLEAKRLLEERLAGYEAVTPRDQRLADEIARIKAALAEIDGLLDRVRGAGDDQTPGEALHKG